MTFAVAKADPWSYLGHEVHCIKNSPYCDSLSARNINEPAVLLVHGFGASTDHWRYNIPVIAKTHEVHALDLLGFGRSAKPSDLNYGGQLWREQLTSYVRDRIGRPTVLVGNSLGGYAALAAGTDLGAQAAGVVLLNAAGYFSDSKKTTNSTSWFARLRRRIGGGVLRDPLVQRLIFENLRNPSNIRRTLKQVYIDSTNVDDFLVESIRRPSLDPGAFGVFRSVFDGRGPDGQPLDELFSKLQAPLLLLWGNLDPWMNAVGKRAAFQRFAPPLTTEVVLEAGHCPHDEVPDQVNSALLDWMDNLSFSE